MEETPTMKPRPRAVGLPYLPAELYLVLDELICPVTQRLLSQTCTRLRAVYECLIWQQSTPPEFSKPHHYDLLQTLTRDHLDRWACNLSMTGRPIDQFPVEHHMFSRLGCHHDDHDLYTKDFCLNNANSEVAFKWIRRYDELTDEQKDSLHVWMREAYEVDDGNRQAWWWSDSACGHPSCDRGSNVWISPIICCSQTADQPAGPLGVNQPYDNVPLKHLARVSWMFRNDETLHGFRICEHINYDTLEAASICPSYGSSTISSLPYTLAEAVFPETTRTYGPEGLFMSCDECRTDFSVSLLGESTLITAWYELASEREIFSAMTIPPALFTWLDCWTYFPSKPEGGWPPRMPGSVVQLYQHGQRVVLPPRTTTSASA